MDSQNKQLRENMLNHLASTSAIFKSQQQGEPDLTFNEKKDLACSLLDKSQCLFLSKFGQHMKPEHLIYFEQYKDINYEVTHHLNRLQRYFNTTTRQKDIKNRRYNALRMLIEKGEYFSESEMMKRSPLLYEQLVGQYLTEKQKEERDNTKNMSYVDLLMENLERDVLRKRQKLEEELDDTIEESDSEDDSNNQICTVHNPDSTTTEHNQVTTHKTENHQAEITVTAHNQIYKPCDVSAEEKQLLKNEFVTNMYQNFLDGKDIDFDYSTIDNNEAYDNVDLRSQDEEEKYFDSESPETLDLTEGEEHLTINTGKSVQTNDSGAQSESEDELDTYMKSLKE